MSEKNTGNEIGTKFVKREPRRIESLIVAVKKKEQKQHFCCLVVRLLVQTNMLHKILSDIRDTLLRLLAFTLVFSHEIYAGKCTAGS